MVPDIFICKLFWGSKETVGGRYRESPTKVIVQREAIFFGAFHYF
jgi:hypothetical protein